MLTRDFKRDMPCLLVEHFNPVKAEFQIVIPAA